MREIRLSGSEGGGKSRLSPYPYRKIETTSALLAKELLHLPDKPAGVEWAKEPFLTRQQQRSQSEVDSQLLPLRRPG